MGEKYHFNPLSELLERYDLNTDFWSATFVESNWKKTAENKSGYYNQDYNFSKIIFQEARSLIDDMNASRLAPTNLNLNMMKAKKRIGIDDYDNLSKLTEREKSIFLNHFSKVSIKKISSLTDYLAFRGNLEAIPLSFLTGTPLKTLTTQGFQKIDSDEWEFKSRNLIVRKAELLYTNGGEIIFPSWKNHDLFPAILTLTPASIKTNIHILPVEKIRLNDKVKEASSSLEMIRAMMHPDRLQH